MTGTIDPLFADHPFFSDQKKLADRFRAELIWNEIKHLEGDELDARLRSLGFDPVELLASFNKAMFTASEPSTAKQATE